MRFSKKSIFLIFGIVSLLFAFSFGVSAEEYSPAVFKTTPFEAKQNNEISTKLYIEENSNLIDFEYELKYDKDLVTFVSATEADGLVGDLQIKPKDGSIHVSYTKTSGNLTSRTEFATLTFTVNNNDGTGSYDFLTVDTNYQTEAHTMIDNNLYVIPIETEFAKLELYNFGDVDLSHNVSIADVTYERQYLAEMRPFTEYQEYLADTFYDNQVTISDAVRTQQHLADKSIRLGNRVNINFYDKDGALYCTKSVVFGDSLTEIPDLPTYTGYYGGVWSSTPNEATGVNFKNLDKSIDVYAVYKKDASPAVTFYKERLTDVYYSQHILSGNVNLTNKLTYQDGYTADIYWSSSDNSILNATTGAFNKPSYDSKVTLTATIISYLDGVIEAQDYIGFEYLVAGEFLCPSKEEIRNYLSGLLSDNIDYNMVLPTKITNENINSASKFEVRLSWVQRKTNPADGTSIEEEITQISRANDLQNITLIATATFNGTPLEDDGKIYFDNIEISTITPKEIRNYIIGQIAANTGMTVTNGEEFWHDDSRFNTRIKWISKNNDIATIENNIIELKNVVNGTPLPVNVEVTYVINGEEDTFVLPYTVTVATDNVLLVPGKNIDPKLYDAFKKATNTNGNLTTDTLKSVKFVYLDLSEYPEIEDLSAITYCTNLRVLNISGLNVREESLNQIATLTKLEALIAKNCNISSFTVGGTPVLDKMINLKMLDLSYNKLSSLDSVLSKKNRYGQLQELYLNDNQLTDISALCEIGDETTEIYDSEGNVENEVVTQIVINRAPMLRFLILDNNHLNDDDIAAFSNFKALKFLSLGDNDITSVSVFKDIPSLLELHLQNNKIEDVRDLRYLSKLQSLYLGGNNLRNIYAGSKEVNLSYLKYLTNLEILYLEDNNIEDLDDLQTLNKIKVFNVNNNNLQSLSFLADKGDTLVELYAENNDIDSFSFIRNLNGLTRLMLAGNNSVYESSLPGYLGNLTKLNTLTLSGKDLRTLTFLNNMPELVRLDVENCNLPAYAPIDYNIDNGTLTVNTYQDNVASILNSKGTLRYLNISNNGFGYDSEGIQNYLKNCGKDAEITNIVFAGANPKRFESLYELTELKAFYADNVTGGIDANQLFSLMTGVQYLSMENCGIEDASWLHKFRGLQYVNLANNNLTDFNFNDYISNRSKGTLTHLYLDAADTYNFGNSYDAFDGNSLKELSLENVNVAAMDNLPDMDNLEYLNLSKSGITSLIGENEDFDGWFNVSRYKNLKTLDVSGVQADIADVKNLDKLETIYAVGNVEDAIFQKNNLLDLYDLYNNDVDCYLYSKDMIYEPRAEVEGKLILDRLADYSCNITVGADGLISNNNPELASSINKFDIDWSISNNTNYAVINNKICVIDYTNIDDEDLILTATIDVYPNQESVKREFVIHTTIIRPEIAKNISVNSVNAEDYLTRESEFTYDVSCVNSEYDNFDDEVGAVYTDIQYSYRSELADGTAIPYDVVVTLGENNSYVINADAPLGSKLNIKVELGHTINDEFVVDETIEKIIQVSERTYDVTYNANEGTVVSLTDGRVIETAKYAEESTLFEDIRTERSGYLFEGWYTDSNFADDSLFWNEGMEKPVMPANDLVLYAKWSAHSLVISFDANGGTTSTTSKAVLCGVPLGELPAPTKTGYTFDGWYTAIEGGEQITADSILEQAQDITLYAHWRVNTYTVTFNANGGSVSPASSNVQYNSTYGSLPTPSRTGFVFNGWYTAATGGTKVSTSTTYTTAGNQTLYAQWTANSYKASWSTGTGYSITVKRTSSPYAGASTGNLSSGSTIYYGDVLSVTYTASTGYKITKNGSTSITVTGNVTSSNIYATATAQSYTYNVYYKSTNGTNLGSTTVTKTYGTTNTITPNSYNGYSTPSSQSVKWDSTSAKSITFYYTPTQPANGQCVANGNWWVYNGTPSIWYDTWIEYRNRTSNSIQVRMVWYNHIKAYSWYGYAQYYYVNFNGASDGVNHYITQNSTWSSSSSSERTASAATDWVTVSVSATTTSLPWAADWRDNAGRYASIGGTFSIPAY